MKYRYRIEGVPNASDACELCNALENGGCQVVSIVFENDALGTAYRIFYKEPID